MMKNLRRHFEKKIIVVLLMTSFIFMFSFVYADELIELEFGNEALEEYMTYVFETGYIYESLDETIVSIKDDTAVAVKYGDTFIQVKDADGNSVKTIEVIVYFVGDELTPWSAATINKPYISGYPDKTFKPKNFMTRAEVAAIFTNLLDLSYKEAFDFLDMQKTHWAYSAVQSVLEQQLMTPRLEDEFFPDAYITREEMAGVISRFANIKHIDLDSGHYLEVLDVNSENLNSEQVHEMLNVNLMFLNENKFYPDDFIRREDVVKLVNDITCLKINEIQINYFEDVNNESENQFNIMNAVILTP